MSETELAVRLERLERDNRRLKRGGFALFAILAALTTIYATQPVPDVIKAHGFDVVDSKGRVRAVMDVDFRGAPGLYLRDADGKLRAELSAWLGPGLTLYDKNQLPQIDISYSDSAGSQIALGLSQLAGRTGTPGVVISDSPSGLSSITLSGAQGFRMDLGNTRIETFTTGVTQHTSAASIVMFGNDKKHHVIWRAP